MDNKVIDFFMFGCLGLTSKDAESMEKSIIIEKCFNRAYLDMNRTIKFKKEVKEVNSSKQKFKKELLKTVQDFYDSDLNNFEHEKYCKKICESAEKYTEEFYYGQAQKILNMTLKYMLLIGDEKINKIKAKLHVPVDSYIMEAASDYGISILNKSRKESKFNSNSLPWSKWDYGIYDSFQKSIIDKIKGTEYHTRIDWELEAWIKIAKKRKEQEEQKKNNQNNT